MVHSDIINKLEQNKEVFNQLLKNRSKSEYTYRQTADKWCLLEIVCHLLDEEADDFRTRVRHILTNPGTNPPPIDPVAWVQSRNYISQDYNTVLNIFLKERESSIKWLRTLQNPNWKNSFEHKTLGTLTAEHFLFNWLGHDYLHLRQITRLLFNYTQEQTGNNLFYAGKW